MRLDECTDEFMTEVWDCAAHLLDYLADFLASDTQYMQSMWFYLIDIFQETAELPHDIGFLHHGVPLCRHAQTFNLAYDQTIDLMNTVILSKRSRYDQRLVHSKRPSGGKGFKSGLYPWQQFLYQGSPGFGVPLSEQTYPQDSERPSEDDGSARYVPMGALAIIKGHTERARALAVKLAQVSSAVVLVLSHLLTEIVNWPPRGRCAR